MNTLLEEISTWSMLYHRQGDILSKLKRDEYHALVVNIHNEHINKGSWTFMDIKKEYSQRYAILFDLLRGITHIAYKGRGAEEDAVYVFNELLQLTKTPSDMEKGEKLAAIQYNSLFPASLDEAPDGYRIWVFIKKKRFSKAHVCNSVKRTSKGEVEANPSKEININRLIDRYIRKQMGRHDKKYRKRNDEKEKKEKNNKKDFFKFGREVYLENLHKAYQLICPIVETEDGVPILVGLMNGLITQEESKKPVNSLEYRTDPRASITYSYHSLLYQKKLTHIATLSQYLESYGYLENGMTNEFKVRNKRNLLLVNTHVFCYNKPMMCPWQQMSSLNYTLGYHMELEHYQHDKNVYEILSRQYSQCISSREGSHMNNRTQFPTNDKGYLEINDRNGDNPRSQLVDIDDVHVDKMDDDNDMVVEEDDHLNREHREDANEAGESSPPVDITDPYTPNNNIHVQIPKEKAYREKLLQHGSMEKPLFTPDKELALWDKIIGDRLTDGIDRGMGGPITDFIIFSRLQHKKEFGEHTPKVYSIQEMRERRKSFYLRMVERFQSEVMDNENNNTEMKAVFQEAKRLFVKDRIPCDKDDERENEKEGWFFNDEKYKHLSSFAMLIVYLLTSFEQILDINFNQKIFLSMFVNALSVYDLDNDGLSNNMNLNGGAEAGKSTLLKELVEILVKSSAIIMGNRTDKSDYFVGYDMYGMIYLYEEKPSHITSDNKNESIHKAAYTSDFVSWRRLAKTDEGRYDSEIFVKLIKRMEIICCNCSTRVLSEPMMTRFIPMDVIQTTRLDVPMKESMEKSEDQSKKKDPKMIRARECLTKLTRTLQVYVALNKIFFSAWMLESPSLLNTTRFLDEAEKIRKLQSKQIKTTRTGKMIKNFSSILTIFSAFTKCFWGGKFAFNLNNFWEAEVYMYDTVEIAATTFGLLDYFENKTEEIIKPKLESTFQKYLYTENTSDVSACLLRKFKRVVSSNHLVGDSYRRNNPYPYQYQTLPTKNESGNKYDVNYYCVEATSFKDFYNKIYKAKPLEEERSIDMGDGGVVKYKKHNGEVSEEQIESYMSMLKDMKIKTRHFVCNKIVSDMKRILFFVDDDDCNDTHKYMKMCEWEEQTKGLAPEDLPEHIKISSPFEGVKIEIEPSCVRKPHGSQEIPFSLFYWKDDKFFLHRSVINEREMSYCIDDEIRKLNEILWDEKTYLDYIEEDSMNLFRQIGNNKSLKFFADIIDRIFVNTGTTDRNIITGITPSYEVSPFTVGTMIIRSKKGRSTAMKNKRIELPDANEMAFSSLRYNDPKETERLKYLSSNQRDIGNRSMSLTKSTKVDEIDPSRVTCEEMKEYSKETGLFVIDTEDVDIVSLKQRMISLHILPNTRNLDSYSEKIVFKMNGSHKELKDYPDSMIKQSLDRILISNLDKDFRYARHNYFEDIINLDLSYSNELTLVSTACELFILKEIYRFVDVEKRIERIENVERYNASQIIKKLSLVSGGIEALRSLPGIEEKIVKIFKHRCGVCKEKEKVYKKQEDDKKNFIRKEDEVDAFNRELISETKKKDDRLVRECEFEGAKLISDFIIDQINIEKTPTMNEFLKLGGERFSEIEVMKKNKDFFRSICKVTSFVSHYEMHNESDKKRYAIFARFSYFCTKYKEDNPMVQIFDCIFSDRCGKFFDDLVSMVHIKEPSPSSTKTPKIGGPRKQTTEKDVVKYTCETIKPVMDQIWKQLSPIDKSNIISGVLKNIVYNVFTLLKTPEFKPSLSFRPSTERDTKDLKITELLSILNERNDFYDFQNPPDSEDEHEEHKDGKNAPTMDEHFNSIPKDQKKKSPSNYQQTDAPKRLHKQPPISQKERDDDKKRKRGDTEKEEYFDISHNTEMNKKSRTKGRGTKKKSDIPIDSDDGGSQYNINHDDWN